MTIAVMNVLDIIIIPIVLALLALAWPAIQSWNRRQAFQSLILRELEEIKPHPKDAEMLEWVEHQQKNFVHQKIFDDVSENRDFILSLDPELVYFVSQLWDAKAKGDGEQWCHFLKMLSNSKYDKRGKIAEALKEWEVLCKKYSAQKQQ